MIAQKMLSFMERASWIRKMFEEGARLKEIHGADKVCDFSLGNPDLPPPTEFDRALIDEAQRTGPGVHSYMQNAGYMDVRSRVADQVERDHGLRPDPNHVIMTCGAAGGLNCIFKAILDPGDEVITPAPFFVEYGFYVDNHGGKLVPVKAQEDFSLDLDAIEAAIGPNTKAILINSPNNPTGCVYSKESLKALAEILEKKSSELGRVIYLVSDEPYRRLVFDGEEVPGLFDLYGPTIITTSFSKDLSIPGERIGYCAINPSFEGKEQLAGAMTLANRILGFVNAPALMQRVVSKVLGKVVDVGVYQRRRDLFSAILEEAGLKFELPKGAFYFFPKTPIEDDKEFAAILQEELILSVPGSGFGCPGHIRIAFCVEEEVIERSREGFKRAVKKALSKGGS